jgi:DNA-binding GntR family transcriptional regulator
MQHLRAPADITMDGKQRISSQSKRLSTQDQAAVIGKILEEDIALGRLKPRERLVEDDLIVRFAAKRHVIRQALANLEGLGVTKREKNRGVSVRDFTPADVDQLYAVRELLERKAAELFPLPAQGQLIELLKTIHARHVAAVAGNDMSGVFRENIRFHRTLFSACGNDHLADAIEQFAFRAHAIRSYAISSPTLLEAVQSEHSAMIEAIERGDREELTKLVVAHIQPAKLAYLHLLQRLGTPTKSSLS